MSIELKQAMSTEQITVADGKYQVFHERGKLWALRNGEPWSRDITGDNLIYWMMMRILELEAAQPLMSNGLTEAETSATAAVPMTDVEVYEAFAYAPNCGSIDSFEAGIRYAESHFGITAQAQKGQG